MFLSYNLLSRCFYFILFLELVTAVTAVTAVLSVGEMPNSVAESEEGIRAIWRAGREGTITNVLPPEFQHLQRPWENFLSGRGTSIVKEFYR